MQLLLNNDELVAEWVRQRIPHMARTKGFGPCVAIGIIGGADGADMLGGVVFSNYHPAFKWMEISLAAATPRWLTPRIITDVMRYPFEQMGCKRLQSHAPRKNIRAREFNRKFGFKQEGILRKALGTEDAVVYGLLLSDWKRSPFNLDRTDAAAEVFRPEGVPA